MTCLERAGFENKFIDRMNRWRVQEQSKGRFVCRRMNTHYAEAMLLAPTTWLGSYFLSQDEETESVALPRMDRKCTDMNSMTRLDGASRCWVGVSQVQLF